MGIRLTDDEAWAFVAGAHSGVCTTLRSDGMPVSLPTWFVVESGAIYLRTPERAKKVQRVRHDSRACFAVESGEQWTELKGVVMAGHAELVDDDDERARVEAALDEKYEGYGVPRSAPTRTKQHYAEAAVIRFVPEGRILSWDNARIRLGR